MAKIHELIDFAFDLTDLSAAEKFDSDAGPALRIYFKSDPDSPATVVYDSYELLDEAYENLLFCWRCV